MLRAKLKKTEMEIQKEEQIRKSWEHEWSFHVDKCDQIWQNVEQEALRMNAAYSVLQNMYVNERESRLKEGKLFRHQLNDCFKRIYNMEGVVKKTKLENKARSVDDFDELQGRFELFADDYNAWKYRQENKLASLESAIYLKFVPDERFMCMRSLPGWFAPKEKLISEQEKCWSKISQWQREIEEVKLCQDHLSTDTPCETELNKKLRETGQQIVELASQQKIIGEKITIIDETLMKNKVNILKIQKKLEILNTLGKSITV